MIFFLCKGCFLCFLLLFLNGDLVITVILRMCRYLSVVNFFFCIHVYFTNHFLKTTEAVSSVCASDAVCHLVYSLSNLRGGNLFQKENLVFCSAV